MDTFFRNQTFFSKKPLVLVIEYVKDSQDKELTINFCSMFFNNTLFWLRGKTYVYLCSPNNDFTWATWQEQVRLEGLPARSRLGYLEASD